MTRDAEVWLHSDAQAKSSILGVDSVCQFRHGATQALGNGSRLQMPLLFSIHTLFSAAHFSNKKILPVCLPNARESFSRMWEEFESDQIT